MKKTSLGLIAALISLSFLSGCAIRMTGPCLGYGCPSWAGAKPMSASNVTPKTQQADVAAKRSATKTPDPTAGK